MCVSESIQRSDDFYKQDNFIEKEREGDVVLSTGVWVEPSGALWVN
jgi:hypothetical protein